MLLRDLTAREFERRLRQDGLGLRTGPFGFRIRSQMANVAQGLWLLYPDNPVLDEVDFADFELSLDKVSGLRRWLRPQAQFLFDGDSPFEPLPADHAYPLLEWSMNWCISAHVLDTLLLHSAVIERDGMAVVMPAPAGSGKSTLCAGLVLRGWRLLSDELGMVSLHDGTVGALVRPVSLKNESLAVIRQFEPSAVFNRVSVGTSKGSVTHMRPPAAHVARMDEPARPRWVIFPRYVAGSPPVLKPRSRAASLLELGRNSFNYGMLGQLGFDALGDLVTACDCYDFQYSQLDDAVATFDNLLRAARP